MQTTQVVISGDLIDLSIGHPSLSLLPLEIMQKAAEHCLNQGDPALLQYAGDNTYRVRIFPIPAGRRSSGRS